MEFVSRMTGNTSERKAEHTYDDKSSADRNGQRK